MQMQVVINEIISDFTLTSDTCSLRVRRVTVTLPLTRTSLSAENMNIRDLKLT